MIVDWGAVGAIAGVLGFLAAIGGGLIAYGVLRQKVSELHSRVDAQDERMAKLAEAIDGARSIAGEIKLLRQSTESGTAMVAQKQEGAHALLSQRMDGLTAEVRSFMQGLAAADKRQQRSPKPS